MKLGCVSYLNSKPLCTGLDVEYEIPSVLAAKLREGEYDAALIPLVEFLQNPAEYVLVDDIAIACHGPVYSVILAHEVPLLEVQTVALDPASLTSNLLFKVLAQFLIKHPLRYVKPGEKSHAQVLIGDPAIRFRHEVPQVHVIDLGEAWWQQTGRPFVFAVWAMRPEVATLELATTLRQAKNAGLAQRPTIARSDFEYRYLTEFIRYDLATAEKEAITYFAQSLVTLGVIPQVPECCWI